LSGSNPPPGARSFALLMHDPDAPTGSGWWHWVLYNIPASVSSLPAGAGDPHKSLLPAGAVQVRTDFGTPGYGGPCPPPRQPHRHYLRLYALKVTRPDGPAGATRAALGLSVRRQALVDSERILTQLRAEGYEVAPTYEAADVVVVNTCGFIDAAVDESLDAIGEALEHNGRVIVTGCLGARPERILERHPRVLKVT